MASVDPLLQSIIQGLEVIAAVALILNAATRF